MLGAIYARSSTSGQQLEGTSLDTQIEQCLTLAREKDMEIPVDFIFKEQASGVDSKKPMLTEIRQLVRDRDIQAVFAFHPARLSRDATDLMMLSEEIAEHGVELLFVTGGEKC